MGSGSRGLDRKNDDAGSGGRGDTGGARTAGSEEDGDLGVYGEGATAQLKIAVQAPPIEGRANSALIEFLADRFGLAKRDVELVSGELSRSKVFLLRGVTLAQAEALLANWQSKT